MALSSTFPHLCSCPRHWELFPGDKDYFATKRGDSGQSVLSPYHRECGVQTLPVSSEAREASRSKLGFLALPLGPEEQAGGQSKGYLKPALASLEIPACLYL